MLGEEYKYPDWSVPAGWALTLSSCICIPIYIIYKFLTTRGNCSQVIYMFKFFNYFFFNIFFYYLF